MMNPGLAVAVPALFVVLWSTGFIGARAAMPHADAMVFLGLRFALSTALLVAIHSLLKHSWPRERAFYGHQAVVGGLLHAAYLGGVFAAIGMGMPAGLAALIVGLQPLLTVVLAVWWLREDVTLRQWSGVLVGFVGLVLVLADSGLAGGWTPSASGAPLAIGLCVISLFGISIATLYQKRYCAGAPLISGACVQYAVATTVCLAVAFGTQRTEIQFTPELLIAMAWLVVVLSVVAVLLLNTLIQRGASASVASLFYLVPPLSALEAWWLFDETVGAQGILGMGVVAAAVFLVMRPRAQQN